MRQRMCSRYIGLVGVVVLVLCGETTAAVEQAPHETCTGPYAGKPVTADELKTVLEKYQQWLEDLYGRKVKEDEPDERRANLCQADLSDANLQEAVLQYAHLQGAKLTNANLQKADLTNANLQGAVLYAAHLQGAYLSKANLQGAYLSKANLQKAVLQYANLQGAKLTNANLQEAGLTNANLQEAVFEPTSLPIISTIARAQGLSAITFTLPLAAVELREAFKKAGLREQARQLTYAINSTQQRQAWETGTFSERSEALFKGVMFELTCQYGWFPGRPLRFLGMLLLVFAIPYRIALSTKGPAGIWMIWLPNRVSKSEGQETPVRVTAAVTVSPASSTRWGRLVQHLRSLWIAFYFSLLSAFQIGWRELNVGTWISRLQPREYTLRATGWVRVVSGIQSLVSVYLLALSVLTYFGAPFD